MTSRGPKHNVLNCDELHQFLHVAPARASVFPLKLLSFRLHDSRNRCRGTGKAKRKALIKEEGARENAPEEGGKAAVQQGAAVVWVSHLSHPLVQNPSLTVVITVMGTTQSSWHNSTNM